MDISFHTILIFVNKDYGLIAMVIAIYIKLIKEIGIFIFFLSLLLYILSIIKFRELYRLRLGVKLEV